VPSCKSRSHCQAVVKWSEEFVGCAGQQVEDSIVHSPRWACCNICGVVYWSVRDGVYL
jgi:hypothetical protein